MSRQHGFTIIEVTLFLAISSFLAISLLVGTSVAVQRQQYRDATQSFANFLRSQYSQAINTENDRAFGRCQLGGGDSNRGQSECVILGRYIETANRGGGRFAEDEYISYPVYGMPSNVGNSWRYSLGQPESYKIGWGAKTRLAQSNSNISVLIYRSPESGGLQTKLFNSRFTNTTIADAFTRTPIPGGEICIYDDAWMSGERLSVFLSRYGNSSDAITVGTVKECSNG